MQDSFRRVVSMSKFNLVFVRIPEPCFLILSFCSIEHDYISFSWTSWDHKEFKVNINGLVETAPVPEEV